jgi:hypothetical protein
MDPTPSRPSEIGTMNEKSLHAALKEWYAQPGDEVEVPVDGYVIDLVRDDLLVEIQTRSFSAIKDKLLSLTRDHRVRLVYPIAREKWIVKLPQDDAQPPQRRKSPKRGAYVHLFDELVSFPKLMANARFSLEVLLIQEEEARRYDRRRAWRRRGWTTHERHLLRVMERRRYDTVRDIALLIPDTLDEPFTTVDLASATPLTRRGAQKMAYCLREMGLITQIGHRNRARLYVRA